MVRPWPRLVVRLQIGKARELKGGFMAGESCKYSPVGINDAWREGTAKVAKIAVATNTNKFGSFAGSAVGNRLAEHLASLPQKIEEADPWSPTQQEVNTYIDFLEDEVLQSREYAPEWPAKERKRAASINDRPSISSTFFWGVVAIAAGCFWWLAKIILEAVD